MRSGMTFFSVPSRSRSKALMSGGKGITDNDEFHDASFVLDYTHLCFEATHPKRFIEGEEELADGSKFPHASQTTYDGAQGWRGHY